MTGWRLPQQLKLCQLSAGQDEFVCYQVYNAEDGSFKRLSDMTDGDHPSAEEARSRATAKGKGKASSGPADQGGKGKASGVQASGKGKAVLVANGTGKAAAVEADGRGKKAAAARELPVSEPVPGAR